MKRYEIQYLNENGQMKTYGLIFSDSYLGAVLIFKDLFDCKVLGVVYRGEAVKFGGEWK